MAAEPTSDTIKALQSARDKCALDLKKLQQALKGMQAKVLQVEAKMEMAEQMLKIAKESAPS